MHKLSLKLYIRNLSKYETQQLNNSNETFRNLNSQLTQNIIHVVQNNIHLDIIIRAGLAYQDRISLSTKIRMKLVNFACNKFITQIPLHL